MNNFCKCGCGQRVSKPKNKYVWGHASKWLKGCIPWNKGLTKEIDERVKRNAENMQATKVRLSEEGLLPSWNRGLTKEMDERVKRNGECSRQTKILKYGSGFGKPAWNKGLTKEIDERLRKKAALSVGHPLNPGCGRGKSGIRKDLNQYFRSTWEANFARLLEWFGFEYEYEPKVFSLIDNGFQLSYRPDFYLFKFDLWVELKGYLGCESKRKLDLFKEQYPNLNFTLITERYYNVLANCFRFLIPNWE